MTGERWSFILRIWRDAHGVLQGQIVEPQSGWRRPFHTLDDLWALLDDFSKVDESIRAETTGDEADR